MTEVDNSKTVFISYRRDVSQWQALLIATHLRSDGYDVFFDQDSINNGDFSQYILNEIKARDHFLLLLANGTMDRCVNEDDWVRREIETALDLDRNIVPLIIDDFDIGATENKNYFPDKLSKVLYLNGCNLYSPQVFDDTMEKLTTRFFKKRVETIPVAEAEKELAIEQLKGGETKEPFDTIIVRGEPEDVEERFIKDGRWYSISIGKQRQRLISDGTIKFIAIYESEPINAIRYYAEIHSIGPWQKKVDQQAIKVKGEVKKLRQSVWRDPADKKQSLNRPEYKSLEKIKDSKTLDELFG